MNQCSKPDSTAKQILDSARQVKRAFIFSSYHLPCNFCKTKLSLATSPHTNILLKLQTSTVSTSTTLRALLRSHCSGHDANAWQRPNNTNHKTRQAKCSTRNLFTGAVSPKNILRTVCRASAVTSSLDPPTTTFTSVRLQTIKRGWSPTRALLRRRLAIQHHHLHARVLVGSVSLPPLQFFLGAGGRLGGGRVREGAARLPRHLPLPARSETVSNPDSVIR